MWNSKNLVAFALTKKNDDLQQKPRDRAELPATRQLQTNNPKLQQNESSTVTFLTALTAAATPLPVPVSIIMQEQEGSSHPPCSTSCQPAEMPLELLAHAAVKQGHKLLAGQAAQQKLLSSLTHLHLNGMQLTQLHSLRACPKLQVRAQLLPRSPPAPAQLVA